MMGRRASRGARRIWPLREGIMRVTFDAVAALAGSKGFFLDEITPRNVQRWRYQVFKPGAPDYLKCSTLKEAAKYLTEQQPAAPGEPVTFEAVAAFVDSNGQIFEENSTADGYKYIFWFCKQRVHFQRFRGLQSAAIYLQVPPDPLS
jgi:hypothetical protein